MTHVDEMDRFFNKLTVQAVGSVDIVIDHDPYYRTDGAFARFQCISCESQMKWLRQQNRYECPSCSLQMNPNEAIDLCDKHAKLIRLLAREAGKKRSFWRRLFGGRL